MTSKTRRRGQFRGQGQSPAAQRLALSLDVYESILRGELEAAQRRQHGLRAHDLVGGLESLAAARRELARFPQGAALAEMLIDVVLCRLRVDMDATRAARSNGSRAPKRRRTLRVQQAHGVLRQAAEKLPRALSANSKAKLLVKQFPQYRQSTIRRIIKTAGVEC